MSNIKYVPFLHIHPELKQAMMMEFECFYDEQSYILGSGLEQFEKEYAKFNQVNHAIGVGNGHDAFLIILKALNIGPGDEVIIPAYTFIATALSIVNAGATPVLVDIGTNTYNIEPTNIEEKITSSTKAIVPVHLFGNPCDMDAIQAIAFKYKFHVIEDNAQAQGASYKDQKTGSMGVMNFTSFYPTKNLGALGDGGMITTNEKKLSTETRALRNYGKVNFGSYEKIGVNSRLDELQARLLSVKLNYLDQWNQQRIEIARTYDSLLKDVGEIQLQQTSTEATHVRHIYPIHTKKRDELKSQLQSKGIETLIHYDKPIHFHKAFAGLRYIVGDFPIAEEASRRELSLPIYPGLKEEEIQYIAQQIKDFYLK